MNIQSIFDRRLNIGDIECFEWINPLDIKAKLISLVLKLKHGNCHYFYLQNIFNLIL